MNKTVKTSTEILNDQGIQLLLNSNIYFYNEQKIETQLRHNIEFHFQNFTGRVHQTLRSFKLIYKNLI